MLALRKISKGLDGIVLQDIEQPTISENEVLIRVHACGVCSSDIHIWHDTYETIPGYTMGHEYSGTIEWVGSNVTDFSPGDRVVSLTSIQICGVCEYCKADLRMLCKERLSLGSGCDGAYTNFIRVPADCVFHLPDNVSLDQAVLCEPIACVVRAVIERVNVKPGDHVLVSGVGVMGLLTAQVAKICGAVVTIAGLERDADRLAIAKDMGLHHVVNVEKTSLDALYADITNNRGFDIGFECSGANSSYTNLVEAVGKNGTIVQVGLYGQPIQVDMDKVLKKEIRLDVSYATNYSTWARLMKLLSLDQLILDPLLGTKYELKNWQTAFERAASGDDMKVIIVPEQI